MRNIINITFQFENMTSVHFISILSREILALAYGSSFIMVNYGLFKPAIFKAWSITELFGMHNCKKLVHNPLLNISVHVKVD